MARVSLSTLDNGLDLYRIGTDGTKATTVLVAFNAGARTERREENGMAHFLEHLVFKGGKLFPNPKAINTEAESIGGVLNAYTSHDLVAFHITCRAEKVVAACNLLTDFVAQPKLKDGDIDRERGVVVQEIARSDDQPSRVADNLLDRAAFGEHPMGRPVLGPKSHIRRFTRAQIQAFRKRQWGLTGAAAFIVGNTRYANSAKLKDLFMRFPSYSGSPTGEPARLKRRVMVTQKETNQSHLRLAWEPRIDLSSPKMQAAFEVYATLLGGSMGSRLFDEIREKRGLCYSISAHNFVHADLSMLYVSSGLQSNKCVEAFERIGEIVGELSSKGPSTQEFERAKSYAAGRTVLAFESSGMVARFAARQAVVYGERPNPDKALRQLDAVKFDQVRKVAEAFDASRPIVACVGPHAKSDFS